MALGARQYEELRAGRHACCKRDVAHGCEICDSPFDPWGIGIEETHTGVVAFLGDERFLRRGGSSSPFHLYMLEATRGGRGGRGALWLAVSRPESYISRVTDEAHDSLRGCRDGLTTSRRRPLGRDGAVGGEGVERKHASARLSLAWLAWCPVSKKNKKKWHS